MKKIKQTLNRKFFYFIFSTILMLIGNAFFLSLIQNQYPLFANERNLLTVSYSIKDDNEHNSNRKPIEVAETENDKNKIEKASKFDFSKAIFSHLHNKIVHFPVALIVVSFFLSIIQLKVKSLDLSLKFLVPIAFFTSILAIVTGKFQEEALENSSKEYLVEIHEKFGYATAAISLIWTAFIFNAKLRPYHLIIALIAFLAVSIAGFYGGVVAH